MLDFSYSDRNDAASHITSEMRMFARIAALALVAGLSAACSTTTPTDTQAMAKVNADYDAKMAAINAVTLAHARAKWAKGEPMNLQERHLLMEAMTPEQRAAFDPPIAMPVRDDPAARALRDAKAKRLAGMPLTLLEARMLLQADEEQAEDAARMADAAAQRQARAACDYQSQMVTLGHGIVVGLIAGLIAGETCTNYYRNAGVISN